MTEFLRLKKSNCKNCYKCIRHCPVKSIRFSGNQAHIVSEECILCGQCFVVCPQNAKGIHDDTEKLKVILSGDAPVVASIAPSFIANYDNVSIASMVKALKQLGFDAAEETAIGATIVKKQYEKIVSDSMQDVIITSCCHSVNLLIRKYYPEAIRYLARVISPMHAHCLDIKNRYKGSKTVFVGPCISKKAEAEICDGAVDCVLTFEELSKLFEAENIQLEIIPDNNNNSRARYFPTAGGILKSMDSYSKDYTYLSIDGLENCISALQDIISGKLSKCFIEMSACMGSCVGGPVMDKNYRSPVRDYLAVANYAGKEDFICNIPKPDLLIKDHSYISSGKHMPGQNTIEDILKKMGKTKPEDELNCGSCGYNTCREKAIAVYHSKADLSMCLPFLKDKAESFSDHIISNTPNGIIVLNEALEVQQINNSALKIMNIRSESDVLGEPVVRILDPMNFIKVQQEQKNIHNRRVYLAEYKKYVEQTIIYDKNYHIIICIMRDVTEDEINKDKKENIRRQTIDITDKVVEKQMRIVHEIASLLGETTAETKIALTKLKESFHDE